MPTGKIATAARELRLLMGGFGLGFYIWFTVSLVSLLTPALEPREPRSAHREDAAIGRSVTEGTSSSG